MFPVLQVGKFSLPAFALDYTLLSPLAADLSINVQPPKSPPDSDKMLRVTESTPTRYKRLQHNSEEYSQDIC